MINEGTASNGFFYVIKKTTFDWRERTNDWNSCFDHFWDTTAPIWSPCIHIPSTLVSFDSFQNGIRRSVTCYVLNRWNTMTRCVICLWSVLDLCARCWLYSYVVHLIFIVTSRVFLLFFSLLSIFVLSLFDSSVGPFDLSLLDYFNFRLIFQFCFANDTFITLAL